MPKVTFHYDGAASTVVAKDGSNVMRAAVENGVDGIVGECGGQAMCATCHVYVRAPYLSVLPPLSEEEDEMLECTAAERDGERSRLGCQLTLGGALEEIEVDLPETQI
ncbi:2Fe-2S iron-sulfur cluster-binding protein [Amycolatopsis orientalis]|uniref:2Fe-2S iron-sulfur cluster-binding protein n=1 Tax=Amycolatopsis orientalis TaxID=31958 RepID=UPI0003A2D39D|nr:2Fe-2S iron-sulfur cluster-binding protein [Amycolatopsis orientalis]